MATKNWTSKADWDGGILDDLYCPIGLAQLEIAYDILTGKATYIFNAERMVNWISFGHTKENAKTVWRDDFRTDSRSRYTLYNQPGWRDTGGTMPGYDAANHRLTIDTGFTEGSHLSPPVTIKNLIASEDIYVTGYYQAYAAPGFYARLADVDNWYYAATKAAPEGTTSAICKCVGVFPDDFSILSEIEWAIPKNVWRTLVFKLNNSSLHFSTNEGSVSATDGSLTAAGKVLFGTWCTIGYMDNFHLEHYTLPSPANNSISVRFAVSNDGNNWSPWMTDFGNCGNSRQIKVEVTLSRTSLASAMPVLNDMTVTYETRKQQPIFI